MSASRTITTTTNTRSSPAAGPSNLPAVPPALRTASNEDDDQDKEEIMRRALARVQRVKERKMETAAKKKAEEEAARKLAEDKRKEASAWASAAQEAQDRAERSRTQGEDITERRRLLADAAAARSQRETSPSEFSMSPRRPIVEISRVKGKGKEKLQAEAASGDPDNSSDGEDDDDDNNRAPCKRCRVKKLSCQMQAGKQSSPSTVKWEGGGKPMGECLAVLESQMAQLLTENWQLQEGQVKANTYHSHINWKLDWLMMDAARQRNSPPKMPELGPSRFPKKRKRVVDSEEEEEEEREKEMEKVEGGEEDEELAPKKAQLEKGKEREE
ncbi:hypothetical protein F5051DRAFT_440580 [Lentinula edodes]|nr:hypothetical protein F5051DRAFT_440580 [Lentinula edodes]